jgi:hemerythrin-like domain-containing protein
MYRHFLVPVGGTDAAIAAIGHALEFARSIGARVTFFHACRASDHQGDEASAESCVAEWFAKAEAAARAQGVPCATTSRTEADSGDLTFQTFADAARVHGCDLICASQDAPWLGCSPDAGSPDAGEPFAVCGIPVLMCTVQPHRTTDLAIGALLAGHRAISAELRVMLDHVHAVVSRGAPFDAIAVRSNAVALRNVLALRQRPGEGGRLFSRLRERTSTLDAELAELERQHQHEIRLIDELIDNAAAIAEGGLSPARFEQPLRACAQFIWEHLGREEGVILPAARRYLSDADWRDIGVTLGIAAPATSAEPDTGKPGSPRA